MDDVAGVLLVLLFILCVLKLALFSILAAGALLLWIIRTMIEAKRSRDNGYRLLASPTDYEEYEDRYPNAGRLAVPERHQPLGLPKTDPRSGGQDG